MAHILLVDDDLSVRTVVSLMLQKAGHTVDVANDGVQALTLAQTNPPELVMSDLCMPGMAGDEVLRRIHEIVPSAICMLMSGDADLNAAVEMMDVHHLRKPFPMAKLIDTVQSALLAPK